MLLRFTVENFQCFKDRVTLDLTPTSDKRLLCNVIDDGNFKALKAIAVYGSNASGKTTIFKALQLLQDLILGSAMDDYRFGQVQTPFVFDSESVNKPTSFEIEFVHKSVKYDYRLSYDRSGVISERLYTYPKKKPRMIFERDHQEFKFNTDRFMRRKIAEKTDPNKLYLSMASRLNDEVCLNVAEWFYGLLPLVDYDVGQSLRVLVKKMSSEQEFREYVLKASKIADFGITNIRDINIEVAKESGQLIKEHIPDYRIEHTSSEFSGELPIGMESRGTLRFLAVIGPVIESLLKGRVIVIDEIDLSFHTDLCSWLVGLFTDDNENKNGAQLIFNTHDMELLDQDRIRRDQVWFTIKDSESNASDLVRLSDFKIRNDLDIRKAYANRSFGGKPSIAPERLME